MSELQQIGRLALRTEGDKWTAYYARNDTMEGAIYLAQIHMRFVATQERREAFMALMREAVSDLVEEMTGERPEWPQPLGQPAPEHEKAGRA